MSEKLTEKEKDILKDKQIFGLYELGVIESVLTEHLAAKDAEIAGLRARIAGISEEKIEDLIEKSSSGQDFVDIGVGNLKMPIDYNLKECSHAIAEYVKGFVDTPVNGEDKGKEKV